MLSPEDNDLLTKVEGNAPMAQLMRQHWTPVCLIEEVAEPDGKPLRVEVLGEKYVAFRDTEGRLGLLDELCPHRKASLVYGRNEECGLRCLCARQSVNLPSARLKQRGLLAGPFRPVNVA